MSGNLFGGILCGLGASLLAIRLVRATWREIDKDREIETLRAQLLNARLYQADEREELLKLMRSNCGPDRNPGAHELAFKALQIMGER